MWSENREVMKAMCVLRVLSQRNSFVSQQLCLSIVVCEERELYAEYEA